MTARQRQGSFDIDELLAQAREGQAQIAVLLPRLSHAAGLSPEDAAQVLGRAERHPQKSKLVQDARRALERRLPAVTPSLRPINKLAPMLGLKA